MLKPNTPVIKATQKTMKKVIKQGADVLQQVKSKNPMIKKFVKELRGEFELRDKLKWIKRVDAGIYDSIITLFKANSKLETIIPLMHTALALYLDKRADELSIDMSDTPLTKQTLMKFNGRIMKKLSDDHDIALVNYDKLLEVFNSVRNNSSHAHGKTTDVDERLYTSLVFSICNYVEHMDLLFSLKGGQ